MFITDNQTLKDLGIFGKTGGIYEVLNQTQTHGGALVLEEMLSYPLNDAAQINKRVGIIRSFADAKAAFTFDRTNLDTAEQYLSERDERTQLSGSQRRLGQKMSALLTADTGYRNIEKGVTAVIRLLQYFKGYIQSETVTGNRHYADEYRMIGSLLGLPELVPLLAPDTKSKLSQQALTTYDRLLRFRHYPEIKKLFQYIYQLDVYISMGRLIRERGFCFAQARDYKEDTVLLQTEKVKHPVVTDAVGNDLVIDHHRNLVFLTGANMAGKSTFMKSVGIAVYLAHAGLPVPAVKMHFTVMDGLFSTINLPDNLGMGVSHFYAEVLRVKKVAKELAAGKRLFVLFDELFRGTNVKDAAEATAAVLEGFTRKQDSLFIVSTHIMEAADTLKLRSTRIRYHYLPTRMEGNQPVYTYLLREGVTEDRHGMIIIRNENILSMLAEGLRK